MPGKRILALCSLRPIHDVPRQRQEPRTDFQVRFVSSLQVHVKLKGSRLRGKGQDSAGVEEFRSFSDGEYDMFTHGIQRLAVSLLLRVADEQNLAGGQFLRLADPANFNGPIVDHRAAGGKFQRGILRRRKRETELFPAARSRQATQQNCGNSQDSWPLRDIQEGQGSVPGGAVKSAGETVLRLYATAHRTETPLQWAGFAFCVEGETQESPHSQRHACVHV